MFETVNVFGSESNLVGIVTQPKVATQPRVGVLLLNSGRVHRIGPNRAYVRLARELARAGLFAVRFDMSGIGDSRPRSDHRPLEECAVDEVLEVVNRIADVHGIELFLMIGNCAGGSVAFQAALRDERVVGVVLVNVSSYDTSEEVNSSLAKRGLAEFYWKSALFDPRRWKKLLTGHSSYRKIVETVGFQLGRVWRHDDTIADESEQVTSQVEQLIERHVRLFFVFSEGDVSVTHFRLVLGGSVERLEATGLVERKVISASDHLFTLRSSQDRLIRWVMDWCRHAGWTARVPSAPPNDDSQRAVGS